MSRWTEAGSVERGVVADLAPAARGVMWEEVIEEDLGTCQMSPDRSDIYSK